MRGKPIHQELYDDIDWGQLKRLFLTIGIIFFILYQWKGVWVALGVIALLWLVMLKFNNSGN